MDKIDLIHDDYIKLRCPIDELHSDQFPYLVIRLMSATYSPIAVPEGLPLDGLIRWAVVFSGQYGYDCCLVTGERECYYISPDGKVEQHDEPPSGGNVINWHRLQDDSNDSVAIIRFPASGKIAVATKDPDNEVITLEPPLGVSAEEATKIWDFLLRMADGCPWDRLPPC
jgi:hypothetical protein